MIWKFTLEMASPAADPINYRWPEEEGMLQQNVALVPTVAHNCHSLY